MRLCGDLVYLQFLLILFVAVLVLQYLQSPAVVLKEQLIALQKIIPTVVNFLISLNYQNMER